MKIRNIDDRNVSERTKYRISLKWNIFAQWCEDNQLPSMPTNSKVIADFIRSKKEHSASTIDAYVSAIRYMHAKKHMYIQGFVDEYRTLINERKGSVGIRKKREIKMSDNFIYEGLAGRKKIDIELLESVVSKIPKDMEGLRDRAMILLRFFSGLQKIHAIKVTQLRFSSTSVVFQNVFRHSRKPCGTMFLPRNSSQELCPVKALEEWIDAAKITDGFLMRNLHRKSPGKPSDSLLDMIVKKHFGEGFACGNMDREEVTGEFC